MISECSIAASSTMTQKLSFRKTKILSPMEAYWCNISRSRAELEHFSSFSTSFWSKRTYLITSCDCKSSTSNCRLRWNSIWASSWTSEVTQTLWNSRCGISLKTSLKRAASNSTSISSLSSGSSKISRIESKDKSIWITIGTSSQINWWCSRKPLMRGIACIGL